MRIYNVINRLLIFITFTIISIFFWENTCGNEGEKNKLKFFGYNFPRFIFKIRNLNIHLHHWFNLSLIIIFILIKYFLNLDLLIFLAFPIGGILQGILKYKDWYHIIWLD